VDDARISRLAAGLESGANSTRDGDSYGWVIAAVLAITETVSWGVLYYAFSTFINPMERDLGWTRSQLTGAYSLGLLVAAVSAVPIGRWLDLHSPRPVMALGSLAGVGLLFAWSQVDDLSAFYAIWAGLGVAMSALLYETAFTVITKWFRAHRTAALTAVTLVAGLASLIFVPLSTVLIEFFGWREALVVLAAGFGMVTFPLHALFLRASPVSGPQRPARQTAPLLDVPIGGALRSPTFWLLATAFSLTSFTTGALNIHLIPFLVGAGYPATFAALCVGVMGLMQIPGRIVFTMLRRLPPVVAPMIAFGLHGTGVLFFGLANDGGGVILAATFFGLGNGMVTLVRALAFAETFGARWYGTIAGLAGSTAAAARALAPVSVALLLGLTADYRPLFMLMFAGSVFAVVASRRAFSMSGHEAPV
jgi:MFS family permease